MITSPPKNIERLQSRYLLLLVTALVLASAPLTASEYISELPPETQEYDLSDLKEQGDTHRNAWKRYQEQMTDAFEEALSFHETEPSKELIVVAWDRFLTTFSTNNPLSEKDELLRDNATEYLSLIKETNSPTKKLPEVQPTQERTQTQSGNRKPEQDMLLYLYEPFLDEQKQSMVLRIGLHVRNAEFDAAVLLSQELLDSSEPLRNASPSTYGQIIINHGVLYVAAADYQLGLSIIEQGMKFLEERTDDPLNDILLNGNMVKGICQLQLGMYTDAEDTFRRAQEIIHRNKGVYNKEQLPMVAYLAATNLRQRNSLAADQQQRFSLLVAEQSYGADSIELLPTLGRLGSYFATRGSTIPLLAIPQLRVERDVLFKNAISMYLRAIEIIETNYGVSDLRLVPALRGLAIARLLEITSKKYAVHALLRSVEIVDLNSSSSQVDRAQTRLDLGDVYIITSDEKATETYLEAWAMLQETPETQQLASSLFDSPVRLYPKNSPVLYLDRIPDAATPGDEIYAELQFDVPPDGRPRKIVDLGRNISIKQGRAVHQTLRASRYRPRIIDGRIVTTEGMIFRQVFEVVNQD